MTQARYRARPGLPKPLCQVPALTHIHFPLSCCLLCDPNTLSLPWAEARCVRFPDLPGTKAPGSSEKEVTGLEHEHSCLRGTFPPWSRGSSGLVLRPSVFPAHPPGFQVTQNIISSTPKARGEWDLLVWGPRLGVSKLFL